MKIEQISNNEVALDKSFNEPTFHAENQNSKFRTIKGKQIIIKPLLQTTHSERLENEMEKNANKIK